VGWPPYPAQFLNQKHNMLTTPNRYGAIQLNLIPL
jgi:hypothetical protein